MTTTSKVLLLGIVPVGIVGFRAAQYFIERWGRTNTASGPLMDMTYQAQANIDLSNKYPLMHIFGNMVLGPVVKTLSVNQLVDLAARQ